MNMFSSKSNGCHIPCQMAWHRTKQKDLTPNPTRARKTNPRDENASRRPASTRPRRSHQHAHDELMTASKRGAAIYGRMRPRSAARAPHFRAPTAIVTDASLEGKFKRSGA